MQHCKIETRELRRERQGRYNLIQSLRVSVPRCAIPTLHPGQAVAASQPSDVLPTTLLVKLRCTVTSPSDTLSDASPQSWDFDAVC